MKTWQKISVLILLAIVSVLIFKVGSVSAQWSEWRAYVPSGMHGNLQNYIKAIIDAALVLAGVIGVIYLIVGGYQYITASGNAEATAAAKSTIVNAVIGLIIIFAAYVIVDFVMNVITNNVNNTIPTGPSAGTGTGGPATGP